MKQKQKNSFSNNIMNVDTVLCLLFKLEKYDTFLKIWQEFSVCMMWMCTTAP